MTEDFRVIAEFIKENIMGCKFVGISSDNELFIEFDHEDADLQSGAALRIKREFAELEKVVIVVKPTIEQVTQMVDDLNELLDGPKEKPKNDLLNIGKF